MPGSTLATVLTQPAPPTDVFHEIWHSVRYVTMH